MKKMIFITAMAIMFSLQGIELGFSAKTGDAEFDMFLNDVNMNAKADLKVFRTQISAEYKTTDNTIDEGLIKLKMEPAELFLSLEMAKLTKKEPAEVMKVYSANKKEGWGVIAKKLGIKPGSKEFKALKAKSKYKKEKSKKEQYRKEEQKSKKIQEEQSNKVQPNDLNEKDAGTGSVDKKAAKDTKGNSKAGAK